MKKIFIFFSMLMIASVVYADEARLIPYRDGDKCGYADRNLKIIVNPQYDLCSDMINDMAHVMSSGKSGFIDSTCKAAVPL